MLFWEAESCYYPAENTRLYYQIITSGGGIISEYPMGSQPLPWQFPLRNRLISGLSDRLLVMEAKERSGTMITVQYALDQGKDVYALPGRVTDRISKGCNQMIADGAGILLSPEYLLSEIFQEPVGTTNRKKADDNNMEGMRKDLKKIYKQIGSEPVSVQYIIEKTQETPEITASSITELELSGLIREVSKNHYVRIF